MATNAAPAARRSAGRPPRKVLSQSLITSAAVKLINAEGYPGLTMAALARSLNVAPSALYNHVESKQDVLQWVEDHVMTMVDVSGFAAEPWAEAVRRWAWSYRDVFARHAPLIPVIAVLPVTGAPETLKMYEVVTAGFRESGWPEPLIVPAIIALESFIYGSAFDATAPADIFDTGDLAESTPLFTSAVRNQQLGDGATPADVAFGLGLDAMIAGLDRLREA
ncbi:TetR/AcrR family transcriptional regulator C-terminal domain-containing protein [Paenarthrobacter sp. DKR-5]|uniref:TetR/AcrR family transcriptional regulator n=1 Tax=Paenarthrobacter sp. DKR-5 TaxID=2835535 RepID=UPI001BDBD6C4|nr:TetR/AcrR family transcriptional regulator [Paenarthrobacter sp. DKR-5]MBT1001211.1 TetR/AcrR family transcriptional regulator C-terminal domain-containing protein [Paenarthrobacter sp. DKR-5]